jgi:Na+/phosphate symporter
VEDALDRSTNMSGTLHLSLLLKAAAPPVALIAIGLAWVYRDRTINAIPATLLSVGLALLALMLWVVVVYTVPSAMALGDSVSLMVGLPLLAYAASLVILVRRSSASMAMAIACGLAGLVPLYFLGGVVLIYSACSFGTGGC